VFVKNKAQPQMRGTTCIRKGEKSV